ncbi:MAG TPA: MFS transporter [Anaeromyxobacteraceae bacterium]|nr:MFS transporter [Anaeromyxobacteraceae bacterium]
MSRKAPLAILFVVVFIDLLGFGMVIPVMPRYAAELGAPKAWTGLLLTGYSLMQFVFAPIWGRLSDRVGRRPVLLGSIAMTAVGFVGYALAPNFGWLLASRLFAGMATANLAIARAYVADVTTPETRAKGMGVIGASFGLGFILGPAIAGPLSRISIAAPGYAAAVLSIVNGIAAWFILPEPESRRAAAQRPRLEALTGELRRPGIRRLLLTSFISILAFSALEATFSLLAKDVFSLDQEHVGYVFAYIGVLAVIMQGALIGPLTRRFGEVRLLFVGLALQAVTFAILPFTGTLGGMLAVLAPISVGTGLVNPSLAALLSRMSKREDQGGTLGIGESASALGRILGPESATYTYDHVSFAFPYVAGGVLMGVAATVALTLKRAPMDDAAAASPRGA